MKHAHAAEAILPAPSVLPQPQRPAPPIDAVEDPPLLVHDLLLDFDELRRLLGQELSRRRWLDAFLLAAGMNQILEDHLHRDVAELDRVSKTLSAIAGPLGSMSAAAGRAARAARSASRSERRLIGWQVELDRAVRRLASASQAPDENGAADPAVEFEAVLSRAPKLSQELRRTVIRLPTCFRSLDQKPEDLLSIVQKFALRHPDRDRPLLVIGLRTSGSYLAPLYAHFLAREGYVNIASTTLRPGQRLLGHEVARLVQVASRGGLVLLTDDPPKTGSSLARTARTIESQGVPRASIKLLLPLLGSSESIPEGLRAYESFLLPMDRWEVHRLLAPDRVRATLRGALGDVERVEALDLGPRTDLKAGSPVRRHVRALFRVTLRHALDGRERELLIYAKGVGLGYFGNHSLAVARGLTRFMPEVYAISDGLLFRAWMPEATRVAEPSLPPDLPRVIGEYVGARNRALAATEDKSLRTAGLNPIWQRIADLLGAGFGRQRIVFRHALHAAAKRLLKVSAPSVIDGSMAVSQWFGTRRPVKVDYDERAFSNQDTVIDQLYSYDPIFDLAVAAADHELETEPEMPADRFQEQLTQAYETAVPPERWLLYQLLHLSSHQRFLESLLSEVGAGAISLDGLESLSVAAVTAAADRSSRAAARADQRYLARTVLADTMRPPTGPLCAIDIDGVLETGWLGYSSATPAGAAALRRLMRHGYRPILATGRSLGEVIDRCRAFGLAGGVAEYGAATYELATDQVDELLDESERADLERIRARLRDTPGVHVDAGYRRIVRVSLLAGDSRRPLPSEMVDELVLDSPLTAVHGLAQTDILPAGIDKGRGVRVLAGRLTRGRPGARASLAFAIGDSAADLSMLEEAGARFGPANSDSAVRASGARIMARSHQAGLAQAISLFLEHEPISCPACRGPRRSRDAALLMTAMSAGGAGRWKKLGLGLRMALEVAR
jgi:hydroxymethylpyrimidine pyrophosphatase-like HAD family hydrolase